MSPRRAYAEDTEVGVDRSIAEIKTIVRRYGATSFFHMENDRETTIGFETGQRRVMMRLPLPDKDQRSFTHTETRGARRSPEAAQAAWEQACRAKHRALALIVKAKMEAVASGIVEFDQEFYAHLVMADGRTVYEASKGAVDHSISNRVPLAITFEGKK